MKLYVYLIIINLIIIIGFYFLFRRHARLQIEEYEKQKINDATQYYDKINQEDKDRWLHNIQKVRDTYHNEKLKLENLNNEIAQKKEFNESMLKMREDELNRIMDAKRAAADDAFTKEINDMARQIQEWSASAQQAANNVQKGYRLQLQSETEIAKEELRQVQIYLEEYKEKQEVINKEILRRRAIEEKEDFYRIQLSEASKRDIQLINSIRNDFSKIDILDKLIYDAYIKKPVDEMIKRVLEGHAPCGIYKITRLKTGEIYIGKSTDVKSRWQQHSKSCYHCGTISHSILHTTMEKDGIDNFTWELLEEVEKDKLNEREKYWINFYNSTTYGLNERKG